MKKIIIILIIVTILLFGILFLMNWIKNHNNNSAVQISTQPTGIILPTSELSPNKLDVVSIDPKDQADNIPVQQAITITLTRPFTNDEFKLNLTPNTPHTTKIDGDKLIVTPESNWDAGTLYTYFFNFKGDAEQVRLYRFTTTGPTQEFLPDTQTDGLYDAVANEQKANHPDTYVANHVPYESGTFSVTTDFDGNAPAHNYFIVKKKITDEEQVKQDVNVWLQQLDLSAEQIQSLDIRYE